MGNILVASNKKVVKIKFCKLNQHEERKISVLTHNWSHAKPTMQPNLLLYQHYESLVLQHKKRADKTAEIEPRYNRLTNKINQN